MASWEETKRELDELATKAKTKEEPINLDESPENADWIRSMHWDLFAGDPPHLVTTAPDLLKVLGVDGQSADAQKAAVTKFMTLPAAKPMPAALKKSLKGANLI